MNARMVRRAVAAIAGALALGLLVILLLPWIASTQLGRERIAYELSAWSGYRVTLAEHPQIEIWPVFRAELSSISFYEWGQSDGPPVMEAERVEIDLSALAALRGDVVFSRIDIQHPLVRLSEPNAVFDLPPSPGGGRMMRAIEAAMRVIAEDPAEPDVSTLPNHSFGQIVFHDGRVAVLDDNRERIILSGLSGQLTWPALNRPASLDAKGVWRDEAVEVTAWSRQPLLLLAGGNSPVRASLKAAPASASFEGTASFSSNAFFEGQFSLETPSLRRALEWSQTDIEAGEAIGSARIAGRLSGSAERLKLENAEINLANNPGMGVLEIAFGESAPLITGTLDFETLDLRSFLAGFAPIIDRRSQSDTLLDETAADEVNLDLRLSADRATTGTLELAEVAASAQLRDGFAAFDISDASAFGGTIQAGIRIDQTGAVDAVELRLLARNVDAGAMALALGAERFVPQVKGNMSVILRGRGSDWRSVLESAEGTFTADFGPGSIVGIDLAAFLELASQGEFFPLSQVAGGSLAVGPSQLRATVKGGVARIEESRVQLDGRSLWLDGIVPLRGRALALSGRIGAGTDEPPAVGDASFFVGGSWSEPFVSPIIPFIGTD